MNDYRRFIILSGPRTGSHMLAQALNSSPRIVCFREVFNWRLDFIQYDVEGYDNFDDRDIALRKEDPLRFLRERIFCAYPAGIQAVGFKYHYGHHWDGPAALDELVRDRDLHVLHLQRRNQLRMLVSLKLAETTGVWLQRADPKLNRTNALRALRHPIRAARRLQAMARRSRVPDGAQSPRVHVSPSECFEYAVATNMRMEQHAELFHGHPTLEVFYEDMLADRDAVFRDAQTFLGVEPAPLEVTLQQQNPQPLRDLIENYDELYEAFKDTPQAAFFD